MNRPSEPKANCDGADEMVDRLLVSALIEARSCERFVRLGEVAEALVDMLDLLDHWDPGPPDTVPGRGDLARLAQALPQGCTLFPNA